MDDEKQLVRRKQIKHLRISYSFIVFTRYRKSLTKFIESLERYQGTVQLDLYCFGYYCSLP